MKRRKRQRRNDFAYSTLEVRKMLAGDIQVLVDDGILLVVGDAQANEVSITQNASGAFVVSGADTTINGNAAPFTTTSGISHITISLADGNDEATVDEVTVGGHLSFFGGEGNDRFETIASTSRFLHAQGENGDDVFEVDLITRRSAYLYLGEGNDVVSVSDAFVGRNLKVFGGDGDDTFSSDTVTVGRRLEFHMDDGNDDVLLSGETFVSKETRFELGNGNDFAAAIPATNSVNVNLNGFVGVTAGDGDDVLAFDSSVNGRSSITVRGGDGSDSFQRGSALAQDKFRVRNFENAEVENLDALVDEVFARLEAVGIGSDGTTEPTESLAITATSNSAVFSENGQAISPDGGITIAGSDNLNRATIGIDGFITGQEQLTFTDTSNISGAFNSTNGVLTLTGTASAADYQQALRSVRYENTSNDPSTEVRSFDFSVSTDQETVSATRDFRVDSVNDLPQVVFDTSSRAVAPDGVPVVLDSLLLVSDQDNASLESAVVTIVNGFTTGEDLLTATEFSGVTSTFDNTTGALTFSGNVDLGVWQNVLRSVTYDNSSSDPSVGLRTIRFTIDDGTSTSSADFSLTVQEAEVEPNRFEVSENVSNGTVVGRVTTDGNLGNDAIYQRSDLGGEEQLLINVDDHLSGELDAPIVMIEYIDFQCPSCAAVHPVLTQLKADFPDDLLVVSRHLPLESIHPNARAAAIVSEAADNQGMFNEMADLLFANQDEWESEADPTELFEGYANTLGLNLTQLRADVANPETSLRVTRDANEAREIGLTGTPSFFLEEAQITNPGTISGFTTRVEGAIASNDNPFQINRETGEIVVYDNTLLANATNTTFVLPFVVTNADGVTESVQATVRVV